MQLYKYIVKLVLFLRIIIIIKYVYKGSSTNIDWKNEQDKAFRHTLLDLADWRSCQIFEQNRS